MNNKYEYNEYAVGGWKNSPGTFVKNGWNKVASLKEVVYEIQFNNFIRIYENKRNKCKTVVDWWRFNIIDELNLVIGQNLDNSRSWYFLFMVEEYLYDRKLSVSDSFYDICYGAFL